MTEEPRSPAENQGMASIDHGSDRLPTRWLRRRNRVHQSDDYQDEWCAQQCLQCRHRVPLTGPIGTDWGACANPASPSDGLARFEHDGCDAFEAAPVTS